MRRGTLFGSQVTEGHDTLMVLIDSGLAFGTQPALTRSDPALTAVLTTHGTMPSLQHQPHVTFLLVNKPATISRDETCGRKLLAGI